MKIRREVKIGLYALAMMLCLYLGINYLKGKEVFSGDRTYYALYDQTKGLQKSALVLLRGVKIGSVTDIAIDPKNPDKVLVTVNIKKDMKIPTDSRLKLFSNGILGSMALELIPGTADSRFEKNAIIPSETESGLLEFASLSLDDIIQEVKRLMISLEATSNSLNAILTDNADNIRGTLGNVNEMSRQLAAGNLEKTLRDLGEFSGMLKNNSAKLDGIIGNFDEISGSLAEADIKGVVDSLGMSVNHLNAVLANLAGDEGSAGKLLGDPALYDSLVTASGNLSALLADLKENPKRYINISVFGGRDKDKKKKEK